MLKKIFSVVINKLRAAAADIHYDTARYVHGVDDSLIYELRFFVVVKHLELYARSSEHFVEKSSLVFRSAHRSSSVSVNFFNLIRIAKSSEHFERFYSLRYSRRL